MKQFSLEAEQSVIGSCLIDPDAFQAAQPLAALDFAHAQHRALWQALQELHLGHKPADVVTLWDAVRDNEDVQGSGGMAYLHALAQSVPSGRHAKRYAEIVRDHAMRRMMLRALDEASDVVRGEGASAAIGRLATLLAPLHQRQSGAPQRMSDVALRRTEHYDRLANGEVTAGWPTRIPGIDRLLNGGLQGGRVYVLAARPGVGKSSLSQWIALEMASQGKTALFLSQEMSADELADRAMSASGRVDYSALLTGKMGDEDWRRATESLERIGSLDYYVDDTPALTLADVTAKARQVPGLKVLVLDYLQLCTGDGDNRNTQVEQISRGLKALSKELNIAVLALSQLNRAVEQRADKRPGLSDLRDSGAIEQDADVVMMLWPAKEVDGGNVVGCAIEKNRQGAKGAVALHFNGTIQTWGESMESLSGPAKQSRYGGDL